MRRTLLVILLGLATTAHANLRVPQVPVNGTGLQTLLDTQGQAINVAADQHGPPIVELANVGKPVTFMAFVRPIGTPAAPLNLYFVYDGSPSPTLYQVCPAPIPPGWSTMVAWENSTLSLAVTLLDENGYSQGVTHYPNPPIAGLSFAISSAGGTFYAVDDKNADQRAHLLFYQGTGGHTTDAWVCAEDQLAGSGGDFDYDDAVYLIETLGLTPVQRTSWGTLKQRFR
jgi:hypothetical protein